MLYFEVTTESCQLFLVKSELWVESIDMPVHLIVTCSNFVPELFLERAVRQLNVLAELIVLSICFLCTTFKIFPRH